MGGPVTIVTVLLLGAALVGTSLIASYRPWAWLPALAFVTTSPQLASWLFDQSNVALALAAIAAYWLVNAVGATGYALRRPRPIVHAGSALHLVGLGLFSLFAIREVLVDQQAPARFVALMVLAAGYALLAGPFIRRSAWREPMAILLSAIAIGVVVHDDRPRSRRRRPTVVVDGDRPGLAWVAVRFSRPPAAIGSGVVGSLVVLDVVAFMYPIQTLGEQHAAGSALPFTSPEDRGAGDRRRRGCSRLVVLRRPARASARAGMPTDLPELVGVGGRSRSGLADRLCRDVRACRPRGRPRLVGRGRGGLGLGRLLSPAFCVFTLAYVAGVTLIVMAVGEALTTIAPPSRLAVDPSVVSSVIPLVDELSIGLAAIALALVAAVLLVPARSGGSHGVRQAVRAGSSPARSGRRRVVACLGSIAVVDAFATFVDPVNGDAALEIATQAQVALTIAWVVAGAVAFAAGSSPTWPSPACSALGLLTLATLKLFIVDLASVDVSYRVLSFIRSAWSCSGRRSSRPGGAPGVPASPRSGRLGGLNRGGKRLVQP